MEESKTAAKRQLGAMELLGMSGFAFFFGWMLVSFYWLFAVFLPDMPIAERDVVQLFVFVGIALGYFALSLAARNERFNPFSTPFMAVEAACSILLPASALALGFGIPVPAAALCAANLLAGLAGAALTVCWLDVCGRIRVQSLNRFTSLSILGGGLLFVLVAVMPLTLQPVLCIIFVLAGTGLLAFTSEKAAGNTDAPPLGAYKDTWKFAKEIEPSLLAFGVVFGLTFVYLFNYGETTVFLGLLFVLLGAGTIVACAWRGVFIGITVIQRVLLCITVLACIAVPFASEAVQLVCSGLVVAAWAAFMSVNYAFIVKKSVEQWDAPTFRQVPSRLVFSALGFLVGWAIATGVTVFFGAHHDAFMIVRLTTAFVLVAVVMLFFPVSDHHEGAAAPGAPAPAPLPNLGGDQLFERRCAAVAELYQLSPRETDILKFLAKGRNAAYIQNKLTISPHTVKSHIYNIYRKLDIHSQQKLMDFIEEYPVDGA